MKVQSVCWANKYSINWGKGGKKITEQMGLQLGLEGWMVRDCERGRKKKVRALREVDLQNKRSKVKVEMLDGWGLAYSRHSGALHDTIYNYGI